MTCEKKKKQMGIFRERDRFTHSGVRAEWYCYWDEPRDKECVRLQELKNKTKQNKQGLLYYFTEYIVLKIPGS